MADVQPGGPYTPTLHIVDANGSPVTSGVTGTMFLYGPTSATPLGSGALAHQGNGAWGYTFAGSLLTTRGSYRFNVATLTVGAQTLYDQGGTFEVGTSDHRTLRQLYTSVRLGINDGWPGTTTGAGATTSLVSARFARGSDNAWVGSEVYIFEPGNVADLNPVTVTSFAQATGTFTFAGQAITSTVAGQDFIIGNREGQGRRHEEVLDAILTAIRRQRQPRRVWDQVSVVTDTRTFEYAVPSDWLKVDKVEYRPPLNYGTLWRPIAPVYWSFSGDRGVLTLQLPQWNYPLRIWGWATPREPVGMNDLAYADGATIRDEAVYELLSMSADMADQRRAASMQGRVERARVGGALARL